MGIVNGVLVLSVGGPSWTVEVQHEPSISVVPGGTTTGAVGGSTPNGGEIGKRDPIVVQLGEPGARDAAWMPALTELPERAFQYHIELSIDEETGRVVARVVDRESGEVVRQVPPDYVLQLAMYIDAWLGLVLDARA